MQFMRAYGLRFAKGVSTMPLFTFTQVFPRPLAEVFDFFRRPAHLVTVSPPDLHMQLVEGPDRLQLGSRIVLQGRRWGVPQRVVSEVVAFAQDAGFTDAQREGPFARWRHTHRFETIPEGTRVSDEIEFEPPRGLLGLIVTAQSIERDLHWIFAYRSQKLVELLGTLQAPPACD